MGGEMVLALIPLIGPILAEITATASVVLFILNQDPVLSALIFAAAF
jgi:hypothetical protein